MARNVQPGAAQYPDNSVRRDDVISDDQVSTDGSTFVDDPVRGDTTYGATPALERPVVDVYDNKRFDTRPEPDPIATSTVPAASGPNIVSWVIGVIVLLVVLYLLYQWVM